MCEDSKDYPNINISKPPVMLAQNALELQTIEKPQLLESIFALAFSNNPDPIIVTTIDEIRIIDVNDAFQKAFAYKRHEVIGRTVLELKIFTYEQRKSVLLKLRSTGYVSRGDEIRVQAKSGELKTFIYSTELIEVDDKPYIFWVTKDISKRKQIEEALRISEAKFSKAFNANPDPMMIISLKDGRYREVNDAWTNLFGYKREEIIGKTAEDLGIWVKRDRRRLEKQIKKEGRIRNLETRVWTKSGELRHCLISSEVIDDETYLLSTIKDISERKQIEEALRVSEEKFAKVFNCSPDPIALFSQDDGHYVEVNDAWLESMGYKREEIIGSTAQEMNLWIDQDRDNFVRRACEEGNIRNIEANFRAKNGEKLVFLFSAEVIEMSGKKHLLTVSKDITKRKKAEEALRLSEDKFAKAFAASLIGMTITRISDGKFIAVNNSASQIMGYSEEELMGKTALEIDFWAKMPVRGPIIERIKAQKSVRELEIIFSNKEGELRTGSYSAEGIDINGEPCILSMIVDISDRKQSEAEIRYLSFHDKLTGLYNRTYFEKHFHNMANSGQMPLTLIMGDVNGLKLINDTLGHQEGDKLLIDVAGILKTFCREGDLVARWGGDEFIILMPNCDSHSAARVVEHIRTASQHLNNMPIRSSISLGFATMNSSYQDVHEVIKEAEDKMYRNKLLDNRSNRSSFLVSLEQTLWSRSNETEEHCRRMQDMAHKIGLAVDLTESELDDLKLLSLLHDIGKIAIPNSILDKPGRLTSEEWEIIKKHPEIGYRIALSSPEMAPIADAILHHHERWDGTGYPLGIKGEDIPFLSRLIAIADSFDVIINGRPYQAPLTKTKAWNEIERCAGTQFDPKLVAIARRLFLS